MADALTAQGCDLVGEARGEQELLDPGATVELHDGDRLFIVHYDYEGGIETVLGWIDVAITPAGAATAAGSAVAGGGGGGDGAGAAARGGSARRLDSAAQRPGSPKRARSAGGCECRDEHCGRCTCDSCGQCAFCRRCAACCRVGPDSPAAAAAAAAAAARSAAAAPRPSRKFLLPKTAEQLRKHVCDKTYPVRAQPRPPHHNLISGGALRDQSSSGIYYRILTC